MGSVWTMGVICYLHGRPNNSIRADIFTSPLSVLEKAGSFGRNLRKSCLISAGSSLTLLEVFTKVTHLTKQAN